MLTSKSTPQLETNMIDHTRENLRTIAAFVGYVAMGVMPTHEKASHIVELINSMKQLVEMELVKKVCICVMKGLMPSSDTCVMAKQEIDRIRRSPQAANA